MELFWCLGVIDVMPKTNGKTTRSYYLITRQFKVTTLLIYITIIVTN